MENILIIGHGDICYNTLGVFSSKIMEFFSSKGYKCHFIEAEEENYLERLIRIIEDKKIDTAFAFNTNGYQMVKIGDENVFDKYDIPFYNWIVDHPCRHFVNLNIGPKKYNVICIDRGHANYVRRVHEELDNVTFIPLGGYESGDYKPESYEDFLRRDIDVNFTASYSSGNKFLETLDQFDEGDIKELNIMLINYLLEHRNESMADGFEHMLNKLNVSMQDKELGIYLARMYLVNHFINAYVREEVIRYFINGNVDLKIYGENWDKLKVGSWGRVKLCGNSTYQETADIYRRSKITLNVMPWFKDGLHDRIPTAMLAGSTVLSDESKYILEDVNGAALGSEELVSTYDIANPAEAVSRAREMLDNPKRLYEQSVAGYEYAKKYMTWDYRCQQLLDFMLKCEEGYKSVKDNELSTEGRI